MRFDILKVSLAACCLLASSAPSIAQTDVPAALEPWRDWVLYGQEYRSCPILNGSQPGQLASHVCAWPGELAMQVGDSGADFEISWTVLAESWVTLPGNTQFWPSDVTVNGSAVAVVDRGGERPSVRLTAGQYSVSGSLSWITRPANLRVPASIGLVRLSINGNPIANPELDNGTLWLGLREGDEQEEDQLDIRVYRLLRDGIPIQLETRIELDVAGQGREQVLVGAIPDSFTGDALESELPAQLESDGTLRIQLRPGTWALQLTAHADTLIDSLTLADAIEPWPEVEIWSYSGAPQLRVTALEGLASVDGAQAGVPADWFDLPAFQVTSTQTMSIVERSRNDASEPNRLQLQRNLWLDFDGDAYTSLDRVSGSMGSGWRLDMAAPYVMTMAETDGEELLVTAGPRPGLQGVELRDTAPDLRTTARLPADSRTAVSGYAESFDRVDTTLHLPPAWRLMAAPGADAAAGAWIERWRLLDLFLVLIITVAAWRLFGPIGGIAALAAMVLTYHEPLAPRWAWLNLLLAIALVRVLPAGRFLDYAARYRALSLAAVGLLLIPFVVLQLRVVVFPQFERPVLLSSFADSGLMADRVGAFSVTAPAEADRAVSGMTAPSAVRDQLEEVVVTGSFVSPVSRYQPGALVQTGPGLPDWAWNTYRLSWSGPVEPEQTWRMIIFPPWLLQTWRVVSVVLALSFFGLLVRPNLTLPAGWLRGGAAAALALGVFAGAPQSLHAQTPAEFPSPDLLDQLRDRLTEPAPCHPRCAELTSAAISIDAERMTVDLSVAAQDAVAVPLPIASDSWRPGAVQIDGTDFGLLYLSPDGRQWVSIEPGVHAITLDGTLSPTDSLTVGFSLVPRAISVAAPGWDVAGVIENRLPSGAIELVRQRAQTDDGEAEFAATVFPPYVRVNRTVRFDLEWSVYTEVVRIAPVEGAFTLGIDLLADESVVTPGVEVENGQAIAAFTAVQQAFGWESRLPLSDTLELTAPMDAPWAESWSFTVSEIWHAEYDGFPASPELRSRNQTFVPQFFPRPGESLTVSLSRPAAVTGDTIAIDRVSYERDIGERSSESVLYFEYRSTQGGDHTIVLPEGAELESVAVDDEIIPLELDGRTLTLQKLPGEYDVEIEWRDLAGLDPHTTLPQLDLGSGASNLYSQMRLPQDRWVLFAYGPTLGPAVLYWAELLVFVLAAFVLGRIDLSPLRSYEWLLLGLGLSTFAWPVLLLFAVWAFVLSWRARAQLDIGRRWFNALQIGLAALTIGTVLSLVSAIPQGLLGVPDMQISSPVIRAEPLSWFSDRSDGLTDSVGVISVSLWFYKAAMLAWALWLSFALLRWLRWAWTAYSRNGYWRGKIAQT